MATDFPHGITIEVIEHRRSPRSRWATAGSPPPAPASCSAASRRTRTSRSSAWPPRPPASASDNRNTLTALGIAAAAPADLLARIDRLWTGDDGMMLSLVDGPDLIFGDASDARRKWLAAARVLADSSAAGATYLDVRIPERVAAGGLGPVPEPTPEATVQANPQP